MSAVVRARSLPIWRSLAERDFRLLWSSEAVSLIGDHFHVIALAWLVIDLTKSGLALGAVLIAIGVPRALLIVPMGVIADRAPARTLMLAAHLARGLVVGAMAAMVLTDTASIPLLALLGVLFGAADAVYIPAQQAFLPRTLEAGRLPSANALLQGTMQLTGIVVPPLAGAAIAVVGTGAAFVVNAGSFFLAAGIVLLISATGAGTLAGPRADAPAPVHAAGALAAGDELVEGPAVTAQPSFVAQIREGIAYVMDDGALRTTLLISLVMNFALSGPAAVGMPWLAQVRFGAGPLGLGLTATGFAVGSLVGTALAGNVRLTRQGPVILGALALSGMAMLAVGVAPWIGLVAVALAVMGLAIGYVNIVALSWLQSRIEPAMIGRVMALAMLMGFGITPLSLALAGWLLDVDATMLFTGAATIIVVVATLAWRSGFAAVFDSPSPAASAAVPRIAAG
jgi:MFS family permease